MEGGQCANLGRAASLPFRLKKGKIRLLSDMLDKKKIAGIILTVSLPLVFLWFCGKSVQEEFRAVRLSDILRSSDIRETPFSMEELAADELFNPVQAYPLDYPRPFENPFGLKKKLDLGVMEIDILFAPPRSEYSYELDLPKNGVLEFGAGIVRDRNFEGLKISFPDDGHGVEFLVRMEAGGRKKTVFQKFLSLPPQKEERTINYSVYKVPLPPGGGKARLTLITQGRQAAFSFWSSPIVFTGGKKTKGIILISADTLRADHLRCYGYHRPTSPNIDSLAEDGVLFADTYSSSPWTLPAHVSLFSGLSGASHQVYGARDRIDSSVTMPAEILRDNAFVCQAITGGGFVSPLFGFSRGFDVYKEGDGARDYRNSAEMVFRTAANWIEQVKDKNYFLFLHTYQTHSPYACPSPYDTMFLEEGAPWHELDIDRHLGGKQAMFRELPESERRNIIGLYDGEIRYLDEHLVGPLVEKLKSLDLYDRTMIVFAGDHGEEFFEHGAWTHGSHLYDESLKVPLIIKLPGSNFRGKKVESIVGLVDIMPTILEVMDIEAPRLNIDGRSLVPVIKGREKEDRTFLADTCWLMMERCGEKGIPEGEPVLPHRVAMNRGRNKLILSRALGPDEKQYYVPLPPEVPAELFNLEKDPFERVNVVSHNQSPANEISGKIRGIFAQARKTKPGQVRWSKELEEQLRALGYIR